MSDYLKAYRARLERAQAQLFKLAEDVLAADPEIEIYHYKRDRFIPGLIFFKGENINSVHFHEVPYRWSGCGYTEHGQSHSGGDNNSMPFTAEDVLSTFTPVSDKKHMYNTFFKDKSHYLKRTYLTRYNRNI